MSRSKAEADSETKSLAPLFKVADLVPQKNIHSVLVVYWGKDGINWADSDLTVADANLMIDAFKHEFMTRFVEGDKHGRS
jgi:hypothetical protein